MRILLILFLMLDISHLCYCGHYDQCFKQPEKIYLFENVNIADSNYEFVNRVTDIMESTAVEPRSVDGMTLLQALDTIPPEDIAIYLYLEDFYQQNYEEIKKRGFIFAGDFKTPICQTKDETSGERQEGDKCTKVQRNYTKLTSKSIDNYPRLFDFVSEYSDENGNGRTTEVCEPMVIVKCADDDPHSKIMHDRIRIDTTPSCETYNFHSSDKIIAVLAPKHFKLEDKLNILTIFYDQLEVDADLNTKDMFPNGISIIKKEEKLHVAFLRVLQMMKWNRVGIISDDSLISKEFEEQLTSLFDKNDVIYGSKSCDVWNCDYFEVLRPIMMADPKILIANVAEEKAHIFAEAASSWNTSIVWLVRNWSPSTAQSVVNKLDNVISITLGLTQRYHYRNDNPSEPRNLNIIMNSIKEGDWIHFSDSFEGVKAEFRKTIQDVQEHVSAYANWYWSHHKYRDLIQSAETRIDISNRVEIYTWDSKTPEISSEMSDCTFQTTVYFYPCNDVEFILLILVLIIFTLSVLGITYFYEMPEEEAVSQRDRRVREYARMAH